MKHIVDYIGILLILGAISLPVEVVADSGIVMGSKGYVGIRPENLHQYGIHLSGSAVYVNSTQNMSRASFSGTTTNISLIRMTISNQSDGSQATTSSWHADGNCAVMFSFSINADMLPGARLNFEYDHSGTTEYSSDGCFFELINYTNWETVVIEVE